MTLSRALGNAYSGLTNSSYRADITAGNIANANTPGYVRRSVVSSVASGRGNGVRIEGIERHQDQGLSRLRRNSEAISGRANVLASAYSQLDQALGVPGDGIGLFASVTNLETNLRELSVTPESRALQNSTLAASTELVFEFNDLSSQINSVRSNADNQIAKSVQTVNQALHRLSEINGDIAGRESGSSESVGLEDERQRIIDTISEIIPIKDIPREGGQVEIVTDSGVFLLAGTVKELEFNPSNAITADSVYKADGTGLSGVFVGDQNLTPGTGGNFMLSSGSLAGQFAVRDSAGVEFQAELDGIAGDLISRFSDDSLDPTKAAGAPGIFTDFGGPLDPANITGLAGRIRLNAAVDPSQGGEITRFRDGLGAASEGPAGQSAILENLVAAMTSTNAVPSGSGLSGQYTASELVAGFASVVGENQIRHESLAIGAQTRTNSLFDADLQASAVDTDYELQKLLVIEQSYAANARVIQTVGDMIDRLLQL